MLVFRLRITKEQEQELEKKLKISQKLGKTRESKQIMVLLAISRGVEIKEVAKVDFATLKWPTFLTRNGPP